LCSLGSFVLFHPHESFIAYDPRMAKQDRGFASIDKTIRLLEGEGYLSILAVTGS
jgi:hypothetical protein